tara:strand:+ start:1530 stop:2120 length:591 start_codon:yes stop_codon:yes gene_type:complete
MSEQDWTLVKVPNKLIEMGISLPVVPIRTNLRSEIFDDGIVKFSAILEELELFLDGAELQAKTIDAYRQSAETIGLLAINEAYDDGEIEQIVKVASKVFDMTNNPLFSKIADSYNAAISDDAEMMSKTGLLSTVIASSVHLFHQGDKDTALSALWPFLQDISANKELSEIMLKTFGITDNQESPKDRLVAFVQALS